MDAQWRDKVSAWDKAYKRKRKIILFSILAVVALAVTVYFLYPVVKKQNTKARHYKQGLAYLEEGNLAAAAEEFWLAGDYKDAPQRSGELNYDIAQQYLDEGEITYAAITFGKAGDYRDAREKANALWARFVDRKVISQTCPDVAGWINPDGTARVIGNEQAERDNAICDVSDWTDLIDIYVTTGIGVGLRSDGTVIYSSLDSDGKYYTTQMDWTDMVMAGFTSGHIFGIKSDGSVKVNCFLPGKCEIEQAAANWTNVIDICGKSEVLVGLRADGTLLSAGCQVDFENDPGNQAFLEDLLNLENVVAIDSYNEIAVCVYLEDGTTHHIGSTHIFPAKDYVSLPQGLASKEAPKHDLDLIVAGFPDRRAQHYEKAQEYLAQGDIANAAIAFGKAKDYEDGAQQAAQLWKQVTPMSTFGIYNNAVVALKQDGTLAVAGYLPDELPEKEGIVGGIYNSYHGYALLKLDGTVCCSQGVTPAWSNVIQITKTYDLADRAFLLALQADGTVRYSYGDYEPDRADAHIIKVADWTGIVDVAGTVEYICGLRSDGTIEMATLEYVQIDLSGWKDVVDIAAGGVFIYGRKADGTVLVTKCSGVSSGENRDFGLEVKNWTDIVAIEATEDFVVGLKADGTMVISCDEEFRDKGILQEEVNEFEGLAVPTR